MAEKIVLAYSGGLDTTVIIPWLKENYDYDVIAVCVDVGQGDDWAAIKARALKTGASACYVVDARQEYIEEYVWPALKANCKYEDQYLLGTSTARPLIGKILVEYARQEGAVAICHGATGKGNDQIRFELAIKAFAPDLKVIAAWRDDKWNMDSRDAEIKFLEDRGLEVPMKKDQSYSRDENIWHLSHEGLELEKTENEPNYKHMLQNTVCPEEAPEAGEYVKIEFEKGVPVSVNGKKMNGLEIMLELKDRRTERRRSCGYLREPVCRNEEPRRVRDPWWIDSLCSARDDGSSVPGPGHLPFQAADFTQNERAYLRWQVVHTADGCMQGIY